MEISKMEIIDYDDVFTLWKNTSGLGLNSIDDSQDGICRFLKRNPETCFIAKENGKLSGVILSGHDGRRGFIYHLAVIPAMRRKGIGKALVENALSALQREGISKVAFVVFKNNKTGNTFWERMGFESREDLIYRNKIISNVEMKKIVT